MGHPGVAYERPARLERKAVSCGKPKGRVRRSALGAFAFLAAISASTLGALVSPATAASPVITSFSGNGCFITTPLANATCSGTLIDGSRFVSTSTFNSATGVITDTSVLTGPTSGTFTATIVAFSSTSTTFSGTSVFNGVTSSFNCTVFSDGTVSGQCGLFTTAAATGQSIQNAATGTSQATTRAQVQGTITVLSARIQSISRDIARSSGPGAQQSEAPHSYYGGLSAGSADKKWGFWLDGSGSYLKNDGTVSAFEGYGVTGLGGVDYNLDNTWLFGFNTGYLRTDVNVTTLGGHRISEGATLGPYVSYIISQHFTVDALFGYARLSNTAFGLASYNSNRFTGALNLNAFAEAGEFALTGFAGYAYSFENPDTSTAPATIAGAPTTIHYGALKIGGEVAYPMGKFEPYVPLSFEYQTTATRDGTSRAAIVFGAGARYQIDDSVKAGIVATTEQARSHSQNVTLAANVRIVF